MYLDFIVDIAKIGNTAILKTETEMIEGTIVKLSKDLIAVKKTDGSVVVKRILILKILKFNQRSYLQELKMLILTCPNRLQDAE